MKKFPFTRPYLELYNRCSSIHRKLAEEMESGNHSGIIAKYIIRLKDILFPIADSSEFKVAADIVQEKAVVFDRLRSVLRLDCEDGVVAKAGASVTDAAVLTAMESDFEMYTNELKEELKTSSKVFSNSAIEIILAHIEDHGKYLWGHKTSMVTTDGQSVERCVYRTNNVLECFFRPVKRNIRRRIGSGDIGYSLEHTKASICYVGNLMSQKYLDIIYSGSLDNLQNRFALYDIAHGGAEELTCDQNQTSRGSLSSSDKKVVRNKNYLKKLADHVIN
jgi:hypothetical protein